MILTPFPVGGSEKMGGKRRGVPVKTLKKILKKAGLKTTGKKAALTRRAKMAKLVKKGGNDKTMIDDGQIGEVNKAIKDEKEANKTLEEAEEEAKNAANAADAVIKGGRKRKSRGKKYFF